MSYHDIQVLRQKPAIFVGFVVALGLMIVTGLTTDSLVGRFLIVVCSSVLGGTITDLLIGSYWEGELEIDKDGNVDLDTLLRMDWKGPNDTVDGGWVTVVTPPVFLIFDFLFVNGGVSSIWVLNILILSMAIFYASLISSFTLVMLAGPFVLTPINSFRVQRVEKEQVQSAERTYTTERDVPDNKSKNTAKVGKDTTVKGANKSKPDKKRRL